MIHIPDFGA